MCELARCHEQTGKLGAVIFLGGENKATYRVGVLLKIKQFLNLCPGFILFWFGNPKQINFVDSKLFGVGFVLKSFGPKQISANKSLLFERNL